MLFLYTTGFRRASGSGMQILKVSKFPNEKMQIVNWEQELNRAQQVNCHQITKELPCKIESMTDWRMTLPSLYLINVCKPHYSFLPAQVVTLVVFRVGELTEAVVPSRRIVLSSW